jgi:hypothetical protein
MKKLPLLATALVLTALVLPAAAFAAKADGPKAKLLAKYDANKNGKLEPEECDAARKDFAADPKGELAKLDTNKDGKLSDEELAALVPGSGKKKDADAKTEKKAGKKKADAEK